MARDEGREMGPTHESPDVQAREGRVGRMSPIDPGAGAGGTIAQTPHTDVASGGSGTTEWGGGTVTLGRAGAADPDADDVSPDEIRNDVRDPDNAYGADRGTTEHH